MVIFIFRIWFEIKLNIWNFLDKMMVKFSFSFFSKIALKIFDGKLFGKY